MKTKILFLFVLAAVALLSFTMITTPPNEAKAKQAAAKSQTSGGLVMEDRNQWN